MSAERLAQIIEGNPAWLAMANANDAAGIVTAVNEKTIQRTDPTLYSSRHLVKVFGTDLSRIMLAGFKAAADADPLMGQMWIVLANGLNFADEDGDHPSGDWLRFDGGVMRRIKAGRVYETWTQVDPELDARTVLGVEERRGLLRFFKEAD